MNRNRLKKTDKKQKEKNGFLYNLFSTANDNPLHYCWIVFSSVFGSLSFWISVFIHGWRFANDELKKNGSLYIASIGILAPCVFSLLYKICISYELKSIPDKSINYTRHRVALVLFGIIICSLVPVFSLGVFCSNLRLQWSLFAFVVFYSFLCYLAVFLNPKERDELQGNAFNDTNKESSSIIQKSEKIENIEVDGERIEL